MDEPAFAWWAPHTLKKRDRILKAVKKRYFRIQQKYGIEMPKTVKRALEIDKETNTTFWTDAIRKEMKTISGAFEILDDDTPEPVGFKYIDFHMVFDIKSDFTRKARYVAGGHQTDPPASITYASVVSQESIRIAFMLAALNDLGVMAADISGAYLNAPCKEKIMIICGPEFGPEHEGKRAKVIRAAYGLKSSGYAWRSHLASVLREELGWTMCKADNDVWFRPMQRADGTRCYEYILVYTDDIICVAANPRAALDKIDQVFKLKPDSIGPPTKYLGADVSKFHFNDDPSKEYWCMGSEQYVKEAIRNVRNWLNARGLELKMRAPSVLPTNYTPELDVSALCGEEEANYYQQQIGVLRWIVELGRIDICTEVSMMASFCAAPRKGHLDAVMHMFAYLNSHERSRIVFDSSYVPHTDTPDPDWTEFYRDVTEEIPIDMPEPLGKPVQTTCFVDSDHAGDKLSRRSRTGVLIFCNRTPVIWYSKKQTSIESASFGSEFSALRTATEMVEGLRYKLRMMGVPIDGPTHVKADNMSVINNTTVPESKLKKKSNSIAYHYVRERSAMRAIKITYENTKTNLADMLTKAQSGPTRQELAHKVLY